MRLIALLSVVLFAACGSSVTGEDQADDGEGDGSGDGDGETFASCKHIDVVISVDNSGSMKEEKDALRDIAFPGFAAALKNVAGGLDDFRVGVLDACPAPGTFHTRGVGGACNFSSGTAWMESTSPALVDEFKCVGDIDSTGTMCAGNNDDEQPASAASAALRLATSVGVPNSGFLRDDALLVVIAITDEDEQPTPTGTAQEVYDRLVAIKGGDVNRMVFLGIGGATACANGAYGSADKATKLRAVTDKFIANQRGVFWDLCDGNLDQGLTQALTTIETACEQLPPLL